MRGLRVVWSSVWSSGRRLCCKQPVQRDVEQGSFSPSLPAAEPSPQQDAAQNYQIRKNLIMEVVQLGICHSNTVLLYLSVAFLFFLLLLYLSPSLSPFSLYPLSLLFLSLSVLWTEVKRRKGLASILQDNKSFHIAKPLIIIYLVWSFVPLTCCKDRPLHACTHTHTHIILCISDFVTTNFQPNLLSSKSFQKQLRGPQRDKTPPPHSKPQGSVVFIVCRDPPH